MSDLEHLRLALRKCEARFEKLCYRSGFVLAPLAALVMALLDFPSLTPEAHRLAAVMIVVVLPWIFGSLPMPVTALLARRCAWC